MARRQVRRQRRLRQRPLAIVPHNGIGVRMVVGGVVLHDHPVEEEAKAPLLRQQVSAFELGYLETVDLPDETA